MRFIHFVLLFLISTIAAAQIYPSACKPIPNSEGTIVLSADKPTVVMIHNISNADIWVTHPVAEPGASAGWSSRLQPQNWAGLMLNEKKFELACIESKPGHEQEVPCNSVLSLCSYVDIKTKEPATASFWVGENMSLTALQAQIAQRGFQLSPLKKN